MLITVLLFLIAGAASISLVLYLLGFGRKDLQARQMLESSVSDWRNDDLSLDSFEVKVKETRIDDVFTTFVEADGDGYINFEPINDRVMEIAESDRVQSIIEGSEKAIDKGRRVFAKSSSAE
ncbi:hypothetical protein [Arcanobacterium ihumii]|uniref:hypothetical protein n=1 Tax=Arcanobacterium ihumii TaxID=2138162 RepID=UPI000F530C73|nr:hypothetical protein [Arcanobacterium ihumii]